MSNLVRSGFMGIAEINGTKIRCTSFSVNPNQDVSFYDHIIGLKDTVPANNKTKGENLGSTYANVQRKIWRPSPISISGGMGFPVTEKSLQDIFNLARYANYFDMDFVYVCNPLATMTSRKFYDCRINDFDINVVAGDIVNVTINLMAKKVDSGSNLISYKDAEKLMICDMVNPQILSAPFATNNLLINGISFKINNNIKPIYVCGETSDDESLLPYDLRVGMQEVTGNIMIYMPHGQKYIPINTSTVSKVRMTFPGFSVILTVVFKTNQLEGAVGPIMTQLPFVGVDYYFE